METILCLCILSCQLRGCRGIRHEAYYEIMFKKITDILKKKEALFQAKEPLFYDVVFFLKENAPHLEKIIIPISYRHGVLNLRVTASTAHHEFYFLKEKLYKFLTRERGHSIRDITVRVY